MDYISKYLSAAIIATVLAACDGGGTPDEQVGRARDFIAASDYASAVIELKNALQQDGNYGEARLLLGTTYLETGDPVSAEKELLRARRLGIPDTEISPFLARALFVQQKSKELFQIVTEGLPPETEAEVLALKARAALASGENRKGKRYLEDALALDEDSAEALLAQAEMLLNQGEPDRSEATLDLVLENDADNPTALALKGDLLLSEQKFDEAMAAYQRALAVAPDLHTRRLNLALLGLQSGNSALAAEQAAVLKERAPKFAGADYIQGLLHFQAGEYSEAIALLSAVEPQYEQFPLCLYFLGTAHLLEGNIDQAGVLAGRFHDLAPGSIDGRKLLATIQLRRGEFDHVRALMQPVLDAEPQDVDAINIMANALISDGDLEEGLALLKTSAELQPDSADAQVKLGAGLLLSGKSDEAASRLQTALELNPATQQADILLILKHLQAGDQDQAIAAAEAFHGRNPDDTTALSVLGRVYLQAGMEEEGRDAFARALEIDPGDPGANQSLAILAIESGDLEGARMRYDAILAAYPDDLRASLALSMLDARENKADAFIARLEAASAKHPDAVEPRLMLGQYYLGQGRPDKVAPLFDSLEDTQRDSIPVLQLFASAQLAQQQYTAALHTLDSLLARAPETAQMHYLKAMAQAGVEDAEASKQSLRRALELDSGFLQARLALAKMALAQEDRESFAREVEILRQQAPDNADVLVLSAALAAIDGDPSAAVEFAAQAYDTNPTTATLTTLAQYKVAAGDEKGALRLTRQWLQDNPEDHAVRLFVANQALVLGEEGAAIEDFEHILQGNGNHVIALNNLAWLLREQRPQQALEYVERARDLAPNSPEILDTLAVVQYANKNYARANTSIREALLRSPDNPSMQYHQAMIAAAMGDDADAIAGLEKLLARGIDFPEKPEAQALLADLQ